MNFKKKSLAALTSAVVTLGFGGQAFAGSISDSLDSIGNSVNSFTGSGSAPSSGSGFPGLGSSSIAAASLINVVEAPLSSISPTDLVGSAASLGSLASFGTASAVAGGVVGFVAGRQTAPAPKQAPKKRKKLNNKKNKNKNGKAKNKSKNSPKKK